MIIVVALIAFCLLIYGPQVWIRYILKKHATELSSLPGTGGELAQHLMVQFQLNGVKTEQTTPNNDHYDDTDKKVRLSYCIQWQIINRYSHSGS